MNTINRSNTSQRRILWIAVGLAIFTAVAYILMAWNILGVGDLQMDEKPAGIIYFAAGCYLVGGLLILLRNRWLLLFGAFINAMVILFFFNLYQGRPAVIFSPGGLISKLAQILLEVALIYVIALIWKDRKNESSSPRA
jgi:mannitol-specific phosphotransferase system IIBC component